MQPVMVGACNPDLGICEPATTGGGIDGAFTRIVIVWEHTAAFSKMNLADVAADIVDDAAAVFQQNTAAERTAALDGAEIIHRPRAVRDLQREVDADDGRGRMAPPTTTSLRWSRTDTVVSRSCWCTAPRPARCVGPTWLTTCWKIRPSATTTSSGSSPTTPATRSRLSANVLRHALVNAVIALPLLARLSKATI
jgi:hypothetical protein